MSCASPAHLCLTDVSDRGTFVPHPRDAVYTKGLTMTARDVLHGNHEGPRISAAARGGIDLGYRWFCLGRLTSGLVVEVLG